jgi:hypothetical protein
MMVLLSMSVTMNEAVEGISWALFPLLMVRVEVLSMLLPLLPPSLLLARRVTSQTIANAPSVTPNKARRQEEDMHQEMRARTPRGRLSSASRAILLEGKKRRGEDDN